MSRLFSKKKLWQPPEIAEKAMNYLMDFLENWQKTHDNQLDFNHLIAMCSPEYEWRVLLTTCEAVHLDEKFDGQVLPAQAQAFLKYFQNLNEKDQSAYLQLIKLFCDPKATSCPQDDHIKVSDNPRLQHALRCILLMGLINWLIPKSGAMRHTLTIQARDKILTALEDEFTRLAKKTAPPITFSRILSVMVAAMLLPELCRLLPTIYDLLSGEYIWTSKMIAGFALLGVICAIWALFEHVEKGAGLNDASFEDFKRCIHEATELDKPVSGVVPLPAT
jgi:hemolysin-activating ACP:hemolysin acyltransferase